MQEQYVWHRFHELGNQRGIKNSNNSLGAKNNDSPLKKWVIVILQTARIYSLVLIYAFGGRSAVGAYAENVIGV